MKRLKTLIITTVVLAMGTSLGMAQHAGNMNNQSMHKGSGHMMGQMGSMMNSPMHQSMMYISALPELDTLNLSQSQKQELTDMRESFMQSHKGQMQGMMALKKQMGQAMGTDSAGTEQVKNMIRQSADMMAGMHIGMVETKANMLDKLDEEQRNLLSDMSNKRMARMFKNNMDMSNMKEMCPMMADGGMMKGSSGMMNSGQENSGSGSGMDANAHQEHH